MRDFLYRLLFTRDDDLDVLQVLFALLVIYGCVAFGLAGAGIWRIQTAAWAWLAGIGGTLAIAAVPRWLAPILAGSRVPGELATGVASAQPSIFTDDERGAHPVRERVDP